MGGLAVASGPNYKANKPHFVNVDVERTGSDEVSRAECTISMCMYVYLHDEAWD